MVTSISCIYGLGIPGEPQGGGEVRGGDPQHPRQLRELVNNEYSRNDTEIAATAE